MSDFGKWWSDLKKHRKRCDCWLPHWKKLAEKISKRNFRYFTFCARPMIDVFMLVREGMLSIDQESNAISGVRFCELDAEHFAEIKDIVGQEDAGFQVRLEDAVLFQDDDFTSQCPDHDSIALMLEDEALQRDYSKIDRLQLKRIFLNVRDSFPYDCINLDFCEYYYPQPPDMIRINQTVERILEWQRRASNDNNETQVNEFILAVTCRHDDQFPAEAEKRLINLIRNNCKTSPEYKQQLEVDRKITDIGAWAQANREDFFFAGWPKDIISIARERGWATEILDYVFYKRFGDAGNPYIITCLVARFTQENPKEKYLAAAIHALKSESRHLIDEIVPDSPEGKRLISDLTSAVKLRNKQAHRAGREELLMPPEWTQL